MNSKYFARAMFVVLVCLSTTSQVKGQVTWDTIGNGNWQDGFNWSSGLIPGATDDVVVDQGGGFLVTLGSGTTGINTLLSEEDLLLLQNIDLSMAMGGTSNGALTLGVNSELVNNGGTFTANGATILDGGNVVANGGSMMSLSGVGSYETDTGTNTSRRFEANDGSTIDLSGMTSLTGGGFIRTLNVHANSGSSIDMSGLNNYVGGSTRFQSDGLGSSINIGALTSMNVNDGIQGALIARNDGTVNAGNLSTVTSNGANGMLIQVDGAGSTLNLGSLTSATNTRLQLTNGGTHNFTGITTFDGSDAVVDSGVTMTMSGVTDYDANTGGNGSRLFQANGGATLDFSNLTDVLGGTFIRTLNVDANSGGMIDFSGFDNHLGGSIRFDADGVGSVIDAGSIASMNMNDGSQGGLIARDGGTVNANLLATLQGSGANSFLILSDGPTSNLNIASLTDVTNARVQVDNGGLISSSNFTNFTGSDAVANNGSSLDLTGLTSYDVNGGGNGSRLFQANNGSSIDLSNLANLQGGTFIRTLNVQANSGSSIDMSGVNNYLGGSTRIQSDGVGSLVDVSAMTSMNNDDGTQGGLIVSNGGEINAGALTSISSASSAGALVRVDGATSVLNAAALTSVVNSRVELTNGGTLASTSGITTFTGSDAVADSGVTLNLTGVTSYDTNGGGNGDRLFSADGAGTVVDLSNVSNVVAGGFIRALNVDASNGGLVDLGGVTNIASGSAVFTADGAGSQIDVSALAAFNDDNSNRISEFHVSNSGQILIGGVGTTVLTDVGLVVESGGQIIGDEIELISTNSANANTTSLLAGDGGTVMADILNTSGIVGPGMSPGTLTIDGDYTQGAGGMFDVEIDGLAMFDMLNVTGNASLDGLLSVTLDAGFDLGANMDFVVMNVDGNSSGNFDGLSQGSSILSDNGFDLRIDYFGGDGNDIRLTTSAVAIPEPGSLGLMVLAIAGVAVRRRRSA